MAPILDRLRVNESSWLDAVESFEKKFGHIVASAKVMAARAARVGRHRFRGVTAAVETFK